MRTAGPDVIEPLRVFGANRCQRGPGAWLFRSPQEALLWQLRWSLWRRMGWGGTAFLGALWQPPRPLWETGWCVMSPLGSKLLSFLEREGVSASGSDVNPSFLPSSTLSHYCVSFNFCNPLPRVLGFCEGIF